MKAWEEGGKLLEIPSSSVEHTKFPYEIKNFFMKMYKTRLAVALVSLDYGYFSVCLYFILIHVLGLNGKLGNF